MGFMTLRIQVAVFTRSVFGEEMPTAKVVVLFPSTWT